MPELIKAKEPFKFYTRLNLPELTGLRASTLKQLAQILKTVPDSCIYQHTHRSLQQHQYLCPEPPNDFAYWVGGVLGENELAERLSSIDTIQFSDIVALREKIVATVENYLKDTPSAELKFSDRGQEFHFIKSISFILSTNYIAYDLKDFADILKKITIDAIYFHIFEARLRIKKHTNDFSYWVEASIADKDLAKKISRLDPYTYTLEDLRKTLVKIVEDRIRS
ncbi:MAG: DUF5752 family protein [Candidatus Omnitrophota bacterium]